MVGASLTLVACAQPGTEAKQTYAYTLTATGSPETKDRNSYPSLGDVTFTRVQKYKLVGTTDVTRQPHFLVISVTKKVGKKIIDRDVVAPVFVKDGTYEIECAHYYDVKPAQEATVDDPQCTLKLLGILKADAPATLVAS
ncbi:hypothetical protein [Sphingomonas sp. Leaf37]|uniref:hypothetical protein n=1 Tax=Sphingomonas sp. Leaf37 TaxID=2876552 RepID=UPI001E32D9D7|nr:hypothetical protein [Sphingomonas sp. Leaf37]